MAQPYAHLASEWDTTLGRASFFRTRATLEQLVPCYGIAFRSAADLGCGTGLFARYLSRRYGVPVFAVDRSGAMLAVAARNVRDANVCLLRQDIRCLRLPLPVDLVTVNFDTLNHCLEARDVRAVLARIHLNLRPRGYLIFDFVTPCQPWEPRRLYRFRHRGAATRVHQGLRWEPRRRLLHVTVQIMSTQSASPVLELHRERAYAPEAIAHWLAEAGFVLRGVHDAATLCPADRCAPRLVVVAQKR